MTNGRQAKVHARGDGMCHLFNSFSEAPTPLLNRASLQHAWMGLE